MSDPAHGAAPSGTSRPVVAARRSSTRSTPGPSPTADGDGVGDLAGIRAHLDDLAWLGIDALWISPFFRSPMADFGYDVSDYCDVDPLFGDLDGFDRLVADAHDLGLRVIIDWVPNHTSDRHPWFLDAASSRDSAHRNWYVWRDPHPDGSPPNNWVSAFDLTAPAWTFHEPTGQWYLHLFEPAQPDLNWDEPAVVEAMHDTLRFWLDRGVDGFRADVIHGIGKDPAPPRRPARAGRGPPLRPQRRARHPRAAPGHPDAHRRLPGRADDGGRGLPPVHRGGGHLLRRRRRAPPGLQLPTAVRTVAGRPVARRASRTPSPPSTPGAPGRHGCCPTTTTLGTAPATTAPRPGPARTRPPPPAAARPGPGPPPCCCSPCGGRRSSTRATSSDWPTPTSPTDRRVDPGGRDGCRAPLPWDGSADHGWPTCRTGHAPWLPLAPEAGHAQPGGPRRPTRIGPPPLPAAPRPAARHPGAVTGILRTALDPGGEVLAYRRDTDGDTCRRADQLPATPVAVAVPGAASAPTSLLASDDPAPVRRFTGVLGPDQAVVLSGVGTERSRRGGTECARGRSDQSQVSCQ